LGQKVGVFSNGVTNMLKWMNIDNPFNNRKRMRRKRQLRNTMPLFFWFWPTITNMENCLKTWNLKY